MTSAQARAGRKLVGLTMFRLGQQCRISTAVMATFERTGCMPQPRSGRPSSEQRILAIRTALEAAGVEFIVENGGGAGVRLRKGEE